MSEYAPLKGFHGGPSRDAPRESPPPAVAHPSLDQLVGSDAPTRPQPFVPTTRPQPEATPL
jgi:hypothetical protein